MENCKHLVWIYLNDVIVRCSRCHQFGKITTEITDKGWVVNKFEPIDEEGYRESQEQPLGNES